MNMEESFDREGGLREVPSPQRESLNQESKRQLVKHQMFVEQQQMNIQVTAMQPTDALTFPPFKSN